MSDEPTFGVRHAMPTRLAIMRDVVAAQAHPGLRVLEVGTYEGASALVWSAAVSELCGTGSVVCVDPWLPYVTPENVLAQPVCQIINDGLESGEVFERFLANKRFASSGAPITHLIGSLREVLEQLPLEGFDIVYIDGDHVYAQVLDDIKVAQLLVCTGGVLCGDDLERQLHECNLEEVRSWKNLDWMGFHPGVTLAVGEVFPKVWVKDGFWAMRKTAVGWESFV